MPRPLVAGAVATERMRATFPHRSSPPTALTRSIGPSIRNSERSCSGRSSIGNPLSARSFAISGSCSGVGVLMAYNVQSSGAQHDLHPMKRTHVYAACCSTVYRAHVRYPRMQSFLIVEPVDAGSQCFAQRHLTIECPPTYELALKTMVERPHVRIVGAEPGAVVASLQAVTCEFFLDGIGHELNAKVCAEAEGRQSAVSGSNRPAKCH